MRLSRRLLFVLGAASTFVLTVVGQSVRVLSVSGDATIQAPGEAAPRALKVGDTIVVGSRIVTGGASRVILTPLPGVKSIVAPESDLVIERVASSTPAGSTVALQQATLDLRTGAITSDLQKTEGVALDYQIRTARGVAGARGTTYTVGINLDGVQTIVVTHGNIAVTLDDGRTLGLVPGQISLARPDGTTQAITQLSDLSPADQAIAARWMKVTLEALAEAVEQGIDIQDDALETAIQTAEQLGLVLEDTTREAIERARRVLEQRRQQAGPTLQEKLEELGQHAGRLGQDHTASELINNERQEFVLSFLDSLNPSQRAAYDALTDEQKRAFALLATDALRLLVLNVNQESYYAFALEFDEGGRTLLQSSSAIHYAGTLSDARRSIFLERSGSVQRLLVQHPSDSAFKTFALDPFAEGYFDDSEVVFYFPLSDAKRTAFIALGAYQRGQLVQAANAALTAYVLRTDATRAEISYVLDLSVDRRTVFLGRDSAIQILLVAHSGDAAFVAFALDPLGDTFASDDEVLFFFPLADTQRTSFLGLTNAQRAKLISVNESAFTAYALRAGATPAEIAYVFNLSSARRTVFLGRSSDLQAMLVANPSDTAFAAFALAPVDGNLVTETQAFFFFTLDGAYRTAFAALPDAQRTLLAIADDNRLTIYVLRADATSAEIAYALGLPTGRRDVFLARSAEIQALLVAHPGDTALADFAYALIGDSIRPDAHVAFYFVLNGDQRLAFLALADDLQGILVAAADPALTTFVLRSGITAEQVAYVLDLDVGHRAAFLSLAPVTQDLLLANLSDTDLFAFAVETNDTGGLINSATSVAYYAGLGAGDRQRFAAEFSPSLREAVSTDTVLAGLAFAKGEAVYLNSVAVLEHYVALASATRPDYVARPADIREQFAAYGKPGLTAAVLDPTTFAEGLAPTDSNLRHALKALLALDPQNQALFETFAGGPAYPKLATAPGPDSWSNGTFTRTGNSFASLNDAQRAQLLALGAPESIMDRSGTYLEAALADFNQLDSTTRAAIGETGWGRFFTGYFADETVRGLFASAADLTAAERATIRQFGFSPYALTDLTQNESALATAAISAATTTEATLQRQNLATLAALPLADRALLSSLSLGDELLSVRSRYRFNGELYVEVPFGEILGSTLAFARSLEDGQLLALREMGAAGWLLEFTPDQAITYNGGEVPIPARDIVAGKIADYLALSADRREAARDTRLFARISFYQGSTSIQTDLNGFLDAWLALPDSVSGYLTSEAQNLNLFEVYLYGGGESQYRSFEDIGLILSGLDDNELGTLRDLDVGEALALNQILSGDSTLALGKLKTLLNGVAALGDLQRFTLRELGIVGDQGDRLGLFYVDTDNLARLLGEYSQLDKAIRVDTRQIDPQDNYRTYAGNNFFFAADQGYDFTTYDVVFNATDDLRVGATRRLSLSQYSSSTTTFNVPAGKSVHLRAADWIELNNSGFSEGVDTVTMVAGTIVLSNVNFPEGSRVALTSKDGGLYFGYDTVVGGVNFRYNVSYGNNQMFDLDSFHAASRGNINIGSFTNPAQIPATYTPPINNVTGLK